MEKRMYSNSLFALQISASRELYMYNAEKYTINLLRNA